jgi:transportin-1
MAGFLPSNVPVDRVAIQKPLLERALPSLIRVVNFPQLNRSLFENTAITLGRMGLVMPDAVAPRLESFAEAMLSALRAIRDDTDKEHAFSGVNAMIKVNPGGILNFFALYADAVASWLHVAPKLEAEFGTILVGYKNSLGDQWPMLFATCPADLQHCLAARFAL